MFLAYVYLMANRFYHRLDVAQRGQKLRQYMIFSKLGNSSERGTIGTEHYYSCVWVLSSTIISTAPLLFHTFKFSITRLYITMLTVNEQYSHPPSSNLTSHHQHASNHLSLCQINPGQLFSSPNAKLPYNSYSTRRILPSTSKR